MKITAPLPPRPSLAQWAAARLIEGIEQNEWNDTLPGERVLSEQIGISRPILREALKLIETEGRILSAPNRPRQIIRYTSGSPMLLRRVLLLFGSDHQVICDDPFIHTLVNALERKGIATEVRPHGAIYALERSGFFKAPSMTILLSVPQTIQRWYEAKGFPALISGAAYPGIEIASVDIDSRAVARHATGNFLRLGHRKIVCISAERPRAADIETEEGFMEAMAVHPDAQAEIVRPSVGVPSLLSVLRRLYAQKSPPSAWLICHAPVAVAASSYAAQIGIKIPENLSIICRDYSPFLQSYYPGIACYRSNHEAAVRQLIRWVQKPPARSVRKRLEVKFLSEGSIAMQM